MGRFDNAVKKAREVLSDEEIVKHQHSDTCRRLVKNVLYKDEELILEVKQRLFASIAPGRIFATERRLIIVKPSFWGLYVGKDLVSPTKFDIIPYQYVLGVSITKRLLMSAIKIHHTGMTGPAMELGISGLKNRDAIALAQFVEEVIEYESSGAERKGARFKEWPGVLHGKEQYLKIDLEQAVRYVTQEGHRFVWLGVEPAKDVARALGVSEQSIILIDGLALTRSSKAVVEKYASDVLVSYDGVLSRHVARTLGSKFNVQMRILDGGIIAAEKSLDRADEEFS